MPSIAIMKMFYAIQANYKLSCDKQQVTVTLVM